MLVTTARAQDVPEPPRRPPEYSPKPAVGEQGQAAPDNAPAVPLPPERGATAIPLPPERPVSAPAPEPSEQPAKPAAKAPGAPEPGNAAPAVAGPPIPAPDLEPEEACTAALSREGLAAVALPPIAQGQCGVPHPISVTALAKDVALTPKGTLNCVIAMVLSDWVKDDIQPEAEKSLSSKVTTVEIATSFDCRTTNRVPGAKMSEHAYANGVDVAAFRLADGRRIAIAPKKNGAADPGEQAFLASVRSSACRRFTTVLGPGSDAEHGDHLHVDLRGRNGAYRICQ